MYIARRTQCRVCVDLFLYFYLILRYRLGSDCIRVFGYLTMWLDKCNFIPTNVVGK